VPAAAVIPAPIAYIKVVAVKKLVVGLFAECDDRALGRRSFAFCICTGHSVASGRFTLRKLECSKQVLP
jgi:hypothetical protein